MRKIIYIILLVFLVYSCKSLKDASNENHQTKKVAVSQNHQPLNNVANENHQSVSVKAFLDQPFGVYETVSAFKKHFDNGVKLKRMIRRNKYDAQKVDTIFKFYSKKSEVFIYKTYFNREILIGGVIADNKFPLINGVTPGMKRDAFFKAFNDLEITRKDSVKLNSKELMREFTFIFDSKGVLRKINFSSYID